MSGNKACSHHRVGADNTLPRESAHSSVVENAQIRARKPIDILADGISISINHHFSAGFDNLNRRLWLPQARLALCFIAKPSMDSVSVFLVRPLTPKNHLMELMVFFGRLRNFFFWTGVSRELLGSVRTSERRKHKSRFTSPAAENLLP